MTERVPISTANPSSRWKNSEHYLSLIESKREGRPLTLEQVQEFIREFTAGKIPKLPDGRHAHGHLFSRPQHRRDDCAHIAAMRDSGDVLKFPRTNARSRTNIPPAGSATKFRWPLAPLLACLGFRVPMISDRGLGITGGTLDKLDSIPWFKTLLPAAQIIKQVQKVGCVICGQTENTVPADKKIYALRDASGTVPSIQLITASILSKREPEGLDALILDVNFGCVAFMQTKADARRLARAMVALGKECGVNTRAILTDMNTPLGRSAWQLVGGGRERGLVGKQRPKRLRLLVVDSAAHPLVQTRKAGSINTARTLAEDCLNSGAPRAKWDEILAAQGADVKAFNRKLALDSTAKIVVEVKAEKAGFISKCDARVIGEVIRDLGGGRLMKESAIHYEVGRGSNRQARRTCEKAGCCSAASTPWIRCGPKPPPPG